MGLLDIVTQDAIPQKEGWDWFKGLWMESFIEYRNTNGPETSILWWLENNFVKYINFFEIVRPGAILQKGKS